MGLKHGQGRWCSQDAWCRLPLLVQWLLKGQQLDCLEHVKSEMLLNSLSGKINHEFVCTEAWNLGKMGVEMRNWELAMGRWHLVVLGSRLHSVAEDDLELPIILLLTPECQNYRHAPPCWVYG